MKFTDKHRRLFWNKVQRSASCWLWSGYRLLHKGRLTYGRLTVSRESILAHRFAWILTRGDISQGSDVLHRCDNPPCCNPDHLFLGNDSINQKDCVAKGRHPTTSEHRGEYHYHTKLSNEKVLAIRTDPRIQREIAADYHIGQDQVSRIKNRQCWRHL